MKAPITRPNIAASCGRVRRAIPPQKPAADDAVARIFQEGRGDVVVQGKRNAQVPDIHISRVMWDIKEPDRRSMNGEVASKIAET